MAELRPSAQGSFLPSDTILLRRSQSSCVPPPFLSVSLLPLALGRQSLIKKDRVSAVFFIDPRWSFHLRLDLPLYVDRFEMEGFPNVFDPVELCTRDCRGCDHLGRELDS